MADIAALAEFWGFFGQANPDFCGNMLLNNFIKGILAL
jgi:hypothetical protein